MPLPIFYAENISSDEIIDLDEDTSRHCVQVLRMKAGEQLQLTNGRGSIITTEITRDHKKSTQVRLLSSATIEPPSRTVTIGISLIKNSSRFEWFLEKVTEIGVNRIIPLICERTEKTHFRASRVKSILVSAMLQSRQVWLPDLGETLSIKACIENSNQHQKFIAHCLEDEKRLLRDTVNKEEDCLILIGPEGDFSKKEIDLAISSSFIPVSMGNTILRTETAGVVAVALLK